MKSLKIIAIAAATLVASPAAAAPAVSAQAYGVGARLGVAGGTVRVAAELPLATGTAPAAFDNAATVASVDERLQLAGTPALGISQSLRAGVVNARAVSAFPDTLSGLARASVADLGLALQSDVLNLGVPGVTLSLGVAADLLTSETGIARDAAGVLVASHASRITGLRLSGLLGGLVSSAVLADAAGRPNGLVDLGAVKLFLNEQGETRGADGGLFAFTNALRVQVTDLLLEGRLVSGQVVIGRSQVEVAGAAAAAAVPEPATWATMLLGAMLAGTALRRRHRTAARAMA